MSASLDMDALQAFVDAEFRHQFRSVVDMISQPVASRVDQFTCWPGLVLEATEDEGRRLILSFRTNPSKLRIGEYVYVNDAQARPEEILSGPEGTISEIDAPRGRLIVASGYQQGPRFQRTFRLGQRLVLDQMLPGARHGRDMPILALRLVAGEFGSAPRIDRIRSFLEGTLEPGPSGLAPLAAEDDPELARLTPSQREAVRRAVEEREALIQGPPGTGKTHVLGLVVRELVRRGQKVAVCAFTHQAINNVLAECLRHPDIGSVAKIGGPTSWADHPADPRLRIVPRPAAFFRQKTVPDVAGFTQHAAFNPVSRALDEGALQALPDRFDVVVFDESGQLTLPAAMMAMIQADRWVFAGDHAQLPPVVQTHRPGDGPAVSVFQHLVERTPREAVLLDRSFRLNAELATFPSRSFYGERLSSAPSAAASRLELTRDHMGPRAAILDPDRPSTLALVRHQGRGQESPEEAALVARLVHDAIAGGVPPEEIAVIAPHRRQNVKIREFLGRLGHAGAHPLVDTVERIQGQERDLIVISMALSDPDAISAESEFLFLPNRLNVALTRARKKLVFVASPALFRALPPRWAFEAPGPSPLEALNVLKRWYFLHKHAAIDATGIAREELAAFEATGPDGTAPDGPKERRATTSQ
ncbi:MAG: AAA domain-containing protein [Planctomycetota bacterium]